MEVWAWLGAYLVGFAILQLFLYRYFISNSTTSEPSTEYTTPNPSDTGAGAAERRQHADDGVVLCEQCGTLNEHDSAYTFCKSCGSRL